MAALNVHHRLVRRTVARSVGVIFQDWLVISPSGTMRRLRMLCGSLDVHRDGNLDNALHKYLLINGNFDGHLHVTRNRDHLMNWH